VRQRHLTGPHTLSYVTAGNAAVDEVAAWDDICIESADLR
jgi:hypothetical protein